MSSRQPILLDSDPRALLRVASHANEDHQYALKVYSQRLEAELAAVDKLLENAQAVDNDEDEQLDALGQVQVHSSTKPVSFLSLSEHVAEDSPFYKDALKRQKYLARTEVHPMKAKELQSLTEAVRTENKRLHAYRAQERGEQAIATLAHHPPSFFEQNKEGIDWARVAETMASGSAEPPRDPEELRIRWLGSLHPDINRAPWTAAETAKAKTLYSRQLAEFRKAKRERQKGKGKKRARSHSDSEGDSECETVDWCETARQLGTKRTPLDCMRHGVTHRAGYKWTSAADAQLLALVKIYGTDNWPLVARGMQPPTAPATVQARFLRTLDPGLARGAWTPEEDTRLRAAVGVWGKSWVDVAESVPGRNNEQCRDRWGNIAGGSGAEAKNEGEEQEDEEEEEAGREGKKGAKPQAKVWTAEENEALRAAVEDLGGKKGCNWEEVSKRVSEVGEGRTAARCRYHHNELVRKHGKATAELELDIEITAQEPQAESSRQTKKSVKGKKALGKDADDADAEELSEKADGKRAAKRADKSRQKEEKEKAATERKAKQAEHAKEREEKAKQAAAQKAAKRAAKGLPIVEAPVRRSARVKANDEPDAESAPSAQETVELAPPAVKPKPRPRRRGPKAGGTNEGSATQHDSTEVESSVEARGKRRADTLDNDDNHQNDRPAKIRKTTTAGGEGEKPSVSDS